MKTALSSQTPSLPILGPVGFATSLSNLSYDSAFPGQSVVMSPLLRAVIGT